MDYYTFLKILQEALQKQVLDQNLAVNNEGNIIRPAKIAIMVFKIPVVTAVLTRFSCLFKYDDRVSIAANPNDSAKKYLP